MKNVPIAIGFSVITASQFVLGIWMTIIAAKKGGEAKLFHQKLFRSLIHWVIALAPS